MKKGKVFSVFLIMCIAFVMVGAMANICNPKIIVTANENTHIVNFDYDVEKLSQYVPMSIKSTIKNTSISVVDGGYAVEKSPPSQNLKAYYKYEWTLNGESVDIHSFKVNSDVTLKAKWTPIQYKVYFNFDAGIKEKITNFEENFTFNIESGRIDLYKPQLKGYTFKGWYSSSSPSAIEILYIPAGSVGDKTLQARFVLTEYPINYHTDAKNENPIHYNVEDGIIYLYEPSKEGHIFKGWYSDSGFNNEVSFIDCSEGGKIDLYPMWDLETYTVTYILPSGERVNMFVQYGATAPLPKLEKNIFEIVITSTSRKNITSDTVIEIKLVNIWYVYLIVALILIGSIVTIILVKRKQKNTHNKLRLVYQSNSRKKK